MKTIKEYIKEYAMTFKIGDTVEVVPMEEALCMLMEYNDGTFEYNELYEGIIADYSHGGQNLSSLVGQKVEISYIDIKKFEPHLSDCRVRKDKFSEESHYAFFFSIKHLNSYSVELL